MAPPRRADRQQWDRIEAKQNALEREMKEILSFLNQERKGIIDANKAYVDAREVMTGSIEARLLELESQMANEMEGLRAAKIFLDSFNQTIEKIYAKP